VKKEGGGSRGVEGCSDQGAREEEVEELKVKEFGRSKDDVEPQREGRRRGTKRGAREKRKAYAEGTPIQLR
jgi:hypothetical protein